MKNNNWITKALAYGLDWWIDEQLYIFSIDDENLEDEEFFEYEPQRVGYYSEKDGLLLNEEGDRAYSFKITYNKDFYSFDELFDLAEAVNMHLLIRESGARHFDVYHERMIHLLDKLFAITFDEVNLSKKEIDAIIKKDIRTYQVPDEIINKIVAKL